MYLPFPEDKNKNHKKIEATAYKNYFYKKNRGNNLHSVSALQGTL